MTSKTKNLTAAISGVVAIAITVSVICVGLKKPLPTETLNNTSKSSTNVVVSVPTTNDINNISSEKPKSMQMALDVGGNPTSKSNSSSNNNNSQNNSNSSKNNANNSSSPQKPPSVTVSTSKDTTQSKGTTPKPNSPTTSDPNYPTNPDDWTLHLQMLEQATL